MSISNKLNRFTTLPYLIDLLKTKKLILLNPKTWEDHNDTDILLEYKNKERLSGLVVLCFTDQSETIHHWKAFSSGESGCCIEFDKKKTLTYLSKDNRIEHKKVSYLTLESSGKVNHQDIPFTKRLPYQCEREYRIIMKLNDDLMFYPIAIELSLITRITLSPNSPISTFETIKEVLKSLMGGTDIPVNRSSIFENSDWIEGFIKRTTV